MDLLTYTDFHGRLAAAEFQRIVDEYDLRWEPEPHRRYPVGEMTWPPSGWVPIERLVRRLIRLGWDRQLAQAKEKFGGLRFYIGEGSPAVRAAIHRAEVRSYRTCDRCGQPGRQRVEEGSAVRCERHRDRAGKPTGFKVVASSRSSAAQQFRRKS